MMRINKTTPYLLIMLFAIFLACGGIFSGSPGEHIYIRTDSEENETYVNGKFIDKGTANEVFVKSGSDVTITIKKKRCKDMSYPLFKKYNGYAFIGNLLCLPFYLVCMGIDLKKGSLYNFEVNDIYNSGCGNGSLNVGNNKLPINFNDTVSLKNGTVYANVKTSISIDSIIIETMEGKTMVLKKSEVASIKKR